MRPETIKSLDNRAVSPWFRAFGGRLMVPEGDAVRMTSFAGNHRVEWMVLSVLMPLVVTVAIFDGLWRLGGGWLAGLGTLPTSFVGLQLLSFALGAWSPRVTFGWWSLVLTGWSCALLRWGGPTPVTWLAWIWLGFMALQVLGLLGMAWQRLMGFPGKKGVGVRVGLAVLIHLLVALVWWRFGMLWGLLSFVSMVAIWAAGTFIPTCRIFGSVATRWQGETALLTIDDGPDPEDTPVILDLLDEHGVKAVFFVIGEKVRGYPELAREIVSRGHELGNHTMTHPQNSMWGAGPGRTRREIVECDRAIEEVTGRKARWYRAPVGHRNFFTHPVAAELGMEVVAWSRRGFDTRERKIDAIVSDLTDDLGSGEILLLHESTGKAEEVVRRVLKTIS